MSERIKLNPEQVQAYGRLTNFFGEAETKYPQAVRRLVQVVGSLVGEQRVTEDEFKKGLGNIDIGLALVGDWLKETGASGFDVNLGFGGGAKKAIGRSQVKFPTISELVRVDGRLDQDLRDQMPPMLNSFSRRVEVGLKSGLSPKDVMGGLIVESVGSTLSVHGSDALRRVLEKPVDGQLKWFRQAFKIPNVVDNLGFQPWISPVSADTRKKQERPVDVPEKGRQVRFSEIGKRFARAMVRSEELGKKSMATIDNPSAPRLTEPEIAERQTLYKEIDAITGLFESRYGVVDNGLFARAFCQLDAAPNFEGHTTLVRQKNRLVSTGSAYWTAQEPPSDQLISLNYDEVVGVLKKLDLQPNFNKGKFINEFKADTLTFLPDGVQPESNGQAEVLAKPSELNGAQRRQMKLALGLFETLGGLQKKENPNKSSIAGQAIKSVLILLTEMDETTRRSLVAVSRGEQDFSGVTDIDFAQFCVDLIHTGVSMGAKLETIDENKPPLDGAATELIALSSLRGLKTPEYIGLAKSKAIPSMNRFLTYVEKMTPDERRQTAGIVLQKQNPTDIDVSQMYADVVYTVIELTRTTN